MGDAQTSSPPRFRLFDALLAGARDAGQTEALFTGFAHRMRFSVGQGVGLPRVPHAVGTDLTQAARAALADLVALVRHRAQDDSFTHDAAPMEWIPRCFGMRRIPEGAPERRAIAALSGTDPMLDAGFLESWLLRGGRGGALLRVLSAIYEKSLEEEARTGFSEPTAWATHLAVTGHLFAQKDLLKGETIRGVSYEALERTTGVALAALLALAADGCLGRLANAGILPATHPTAVLLRAACSPLSLVAIRQSVLRPTPNPYRLTRELADALDALGLDPLAPRVPCDEKVRALEALLSRDRGVTALAVDVWGMNELRSTVLAYLRQWESGPDPRHEALLAATLGHATVSACLKDSGRFDAAGHAIASLVKDAGGGDRAEAAGMVLEAFHHASKGAFDAGAAARRAARAWVLWRVDRWVEERADAARAVLVDRAREFDVAELKSQWQLGKVYRFAPDDLPILCQARAREDGHLFLDLKGFTRMVARAKEVSTAELLKHHFYLPILDRARRYRDAGRRLELNNLLGDAVSFSGDVVSLVHLAEDVNELFRAHERWLREREPSAEGHIEAGLFIAYGAAAEVITVNDPVWSDAGIAEYSKEGKSHRVKVAIAEKINESARGTARNPAVWARMQALLAERRALSPGERDLELPWRVFVDKGLQVKLPSRVMELVEQAIEARSPELSRMATDVMRDAFAGVLARIVEEGNDGAVFAQAADLYNVGRALSKEALDAFIRETASYRLIARRDLAVSELHPDFRRFAFPEGNLRLVVSWDTGKARPRPLVFRFAGDLTFRGFEGVHATEIYEIVDQQSSFYELLEEHYLPGWRPG